MTRLTSFLKHTRYTLPVDQCAPVLLRLRASACVLCLAARVVYRGSGRGEWRERDARTALSGLGSA